MMPGNPNWWIMNDMHHLSPPSIFPSQSHHLPNPDRSSWSQLLLGAGVGGGEEERLGASLFQQQIWEEQVMNLNPSFARVSVLDKISTSNPQNISYDHHHTNSIPVSSPTSCITSLSTNNVFNFSAAKSTHRKNQQHSSKCNSTGTGGASKKARVQPAFKVRKEKLGDRITALHQLVSPFGKTDTASVLSEAIGYIRFLQGQIEALSSPYMRNESGQNEEKCVQQRNCLFSQHTSQDSQGRNGVKELSARGLCLVPISCTQLVGNDTGTDYWAPAAFGGGF